MLLDRSVRSFSSPSCLFLAFCSFAFFPNETRQKKRNASSTLRWHSLICCRKKKSQGERRRNHNCVHQPIRGKVTPWRAEEFITRRLRMESTNKKDSRGIWKGKTWQTSRRRASRISREEPFLSFVSILCFLFCLFLLRCSFFSSLDPSSFLLSPFSLPVLDSSSSSLCLWVSSFILVVSLFREPAGFVFSFPHFVVLSFFLSVCLPHSLIFHSNLIFPDLSEQLLFAFKKHEKMRRQSGGLQQSRGSDISFRSLHFIPLPCPPPLTHSLADLPSCFCPSSFSFLSSSLFCYSLSFHSSSHTWTLSLSSVFLFFYLSISRSLARSLLLVHLSQIFFLFSLLFRSLRVLTEREEGRWGEVAEWEWQTEKQNRVERKANETEGRWGERRRWKNGKVECRQSKAKERGRKRNKIITKGEGESRGKKEEEERETSKRKKEKWKRKGMKRIGEI